ncbi:MAG: phosphoribosylpyrophosphate synthetase [Candidatus Endolissoclinum sp. TMED37]|nr:MAG: phosphoribosylpyrophosphate synthetase [Candidatus Endolissoclinum sp. TMED37]
MKIISGNSNRNLAQAIAEHCFSDLVPAKIETFADGECNVEFQENIRGEDVFIIQSTSSPVNDNVMELMIMIDAAKRSSARRITAVIPYFGYARQDRKSASRTPITAKLIANLLTKAGADRILTMDLHAGQIQGFFDIPVDDLTSRLVFVKDIKKTIGIIDDPNVKQAETVFVSPDAGGTVRARKFADMFHAHYAIVDKRRPEAGVAEVMNLIGDVKGKHAILVDDIIDSGGTLCNAAQAILDAGALSVRAYITHGVLSGKACRRIEDSVLEECVITDSIDFNCPNDCKKTRVVSVCTLIGEAMRRVSNEESVSSLFTQKVS